jgi:hypothetical protein
VEADSSSDVPEVIDSTRLVFDDDSDDEEGEFQKLLEKLNPGKLQKKVKNRQTSVDEINNYQYSDERLDSVDSNDEF